MSGSTEYYPCFLCGKLLDIRYSKRNKPYLICDQCGMQVFIRRGGGIDLFNKSKEEVLAYQGGIKTLLLVNQIRPLKNRLAVLQRPDSLLDAFNRTPKYPLEEAVLEAQIDRIERELKELVKG